MKTKNKILKVSFLILLYLGITFYMGFKLYSLFIILWAIYYIFSDDIEKKNKKFDKDGTIPISSKVPKIFREK